jgi:hypothetical protein
MDDASLEVAVTPGQEVSRRGKSVLSSGGAVGEEAIELCCILAS